MSHYVYKVVHVPTGQFYIGLRSTSCRPEQDVEYMGSGIRIRRLLARHPRSEFLKIVLRRFLARLDAAGYERSVVSEDLLKHPLCLNLTVGGGAPLATDEIRRKISTALKGHPVSTELREHYRVLASARRHSPETRARMSAARKGQPRTVAWLANMSNALRGRRFTPEWRAKLSASAKLRWARGA